MTQELYHKEGANAMAKVIDIKYGGDYAELSAYEKTFNLLVCANPAQFTSRIQTITYINNLCNDLNDIKWELERTYGLFHDICSEEEAVKEKQEAETE